MNECMETILECELDRMQIYLAFRSLDLFCVTDVMRRIQQVNVYVIIQHILTYLCRHAASSTKTENEHAMH